MPRPLDYAAIRKDHAAEPITTETQRTRRFHRDCLCATSVLLTASFCARREEFRLQDNAIVQRAKARRTETPPARPGARSVGMDWAAAKAVATTPDKRRFAEARRRLDSLCGDRLRGRRLKFRHCSPAGPGLDCETRLRASGSIHLGCGYTLCGSLCLCGDPPVTVRSLAHSHP